MRYMKNVKKANSSCTSFCIGVLSGKIPEGGNFTKVSAEKIKTVHSKNPVKVHVMKSVEKDFYYIPRHGEERTIPPHMINYRANISALKSAGVKFIIALNSAGSLKSQIPPGSIVIPDDYINLWDPVTFFDDKIVHGMPSLSQVLRKSILEAARRTGMKVIDRGVYVNTRGPMLETPAEVRLLKSFGDLVGMTMAKEAALAKEAGLEYASICSVDNYANGITPKPLNNDEIVSTSRKNFESVLRLLSETLKNL